MHHALSLEPLFEFILVQVSDIKHSSVYYLLLFTVHMNNLQCNSEPATGDGEWGHLAQFAKYASSTTVDDYRIMNYNESLLIKDYAHAGHCMVYSLWDNKVLNRYNPRAAILMQVRFDGYLGFPGGLVDEGEDVVTAVNRELEEEINMSTSKHKVNLEDHVVTHVNDKIKLVTHFFALQVTYDDFVAIEKGCLDAEDYGQEVLGVIRPTLYTMGDNYRGFPAFLNHNFVANAKEQFLKALLSTHILSDQEIELGVKNSVIGKK